MNAQNFTRDSNDYKPRGCTAFYDVLGCVLDHYSEIENEENNLVAIFSDGTDTCSEIFQEQKIAEKIEDLKFNFNWNFIFFGINAAGSSGSAAQSMADRLEIENYADLSSAIEKIDEDRRIISMKELKRGAREYMEQDFEDLLRNV